MASRGKDALIDEILFNFADNTTGDITAEDIRNFFVNLIDSYPNVSSLSSGHVPLLGDTDGVAVASGIQSINNNLLIPDNALIEHSSLQVGETLSIGEQGAQPYFTSLLERAVGSETQYLPVLYGVNPAAPSLRPIVSERTAASSWVQINTDADNSIPLSSETSATFVYTADNTATIYGLRLTFGTDATNVRINVVDVETGISVQHFPSLLAWNTGEAGNDYTAGAQTINLVSSQFDTIAGQDYRFEVRAETGTLLGSAGGTMALALRIHPYAIRFLAYNDDTIRGELVTYNNFMQADGAYRGPLWRDSTDNLRQVFHATTARHRPDLPSTRPFHLRTANEATIITATTAHDSTFDLATGIARATIMQNQGFLWSVTIKVASVVAGVTVALVNSSDNTVLRTWPSRVAWDAGTSDETFQVGDQTIEFSSPLILRTNQNYELWVSGNSGTIEVDENDALYWEAQYQPAVDETLAYLSDVGTGGESYLGTIGGAGADFTTWPSGNEGNFLIAYDNSLIADVHLRYGKVYRCNADDTQENTPANWIRLRDSDDDTAPRVLNHSGNLHIEEITATNRNQYFNRVIFVRGAAERRIVIDNDAVWPDGDTLTIVNDGTANASLLLRSSNSLRFQKSTNNVFYALEENETTVFVRRGTSIYPVHAARYSGRDYYLGTIGTSGADHTAWPEGHGGFYLIAADNTTVGGRQLEQGRRYRCTTDDTDDDTPNNWQLMPVPPAAEATTPNGEEIVVDNTIQSVAGYDGAPMHRDLIRDPGDADRFYATPTYEISDNAASTRPVVSTYNQNTSVLIVTGSTAQSTVTFPHTLTYDVSSFDGLVFSAEINIQTAATNFRLAVVDDENDIIVAYWPSREAWETGSGGQDLAVGTHTIDYAATHAPFAHRPGRTYNVEFRADSGVLNANSAGRALYNLQAKSATQESLAYQSDLSDVVRTSNLSVIDHDLYLGTIGAAGSTFTAWPAGHLGHYVRAADSTTVGGVALMQNREYRCTVDSTNANTPANWELVPLAQPDLSGYGRRLGTFSRDNFNPVGDFTALPAANRNDYLVALQTASIDGLQVFQHQRYYCTTDNTPAGTAANWAIDPIPPLPQTSWSGISSLGSGWTSTSLFIYRNVAGIVFVGGRIRSSSSSNSNSILTLPDEARPQRDIRTQIPMGTSGACLLFIDTSEQTMVVTSGLSANQDLHFDGMSWLGAEVPDL